MDRFFWLQLTLGLLAIGFAISGYRRGSALGFFTARREQENGLFWLAILVQAFVGVLFIGGAIYQLLGEH